MREAFGSECKPPSESDLGEWQPVRIAPTKEIAMHHGYVRAVKFWEGHQGEIIKVRPMDRDIGHFYPDSSFDCGGARFEVHPDCNLYLDFMRLGFICEHQFYAD